MDAILDCACGLDDEVRQRQGVMVWQSSLAVMDLITNILVLVEWFQNDWIPLGLLQLLVILTSNIWQGSRSFDFSYGMITAGVVGRNPCAWIFSLVGIGHIYTLLSNWNELYKLSAFHRYLLVRLCQTLAESFPSGGLQIYVMVISGKYTIISLISIIITSISIGQALSKFFQRFVEFKNDPIEANVYDIYYQQNDRTTSKSRQSRHTNRDKQKTNRDRDKDRDRDNNDGRKSSKHGKNNKNSKNKNNSNGSSPTSNNDDDDDGDEEEEQGQRGSMMLPIHVPQSSVLPNLSPIKAKIVIDGWLYICLSIILTSDWILRCFSVALLLSTSTNIYSILLLLIIYIFEAIILINDLFLDDNGINDNKNNNNNNSNNNNNNDNNNNNNDNKKNKNNKSKHQDKHAAASRSSSNPNSNPISNPISSATSAENNVDIIEIEMAGNNSGSENEMVVDIGNSTSNFSSSSSVNTQLEIQQDMQRYDDDPSYKYNSYSDRNKRNLPLWVKMAYVFLFAASKLGSGYSNITKLKFTDKIEIFVRFLMSILLVISYYFIKINENEELTYIMMILNGIAAIVFVISFKIWSTFVGFNLKTNDQQSRVESERTATANDA